MLAKSPSPCALARRLLAAALAACLPWGTPTLAGTPTLTTITIDGNMSDWAGVLADPDNVFLDGPAGGLADMDLPSVSALDVDTVAYTWDPMNIYFYLHRQGTESAILYYWFFIDADNDGRFETGEPVLRVRWRGGNGNTGLRIDTYVAADPVNGDAVAGGGHDGYVLPGTTSNGPAVANPTGGSPNGLAMETYIPWTTLGVPAGSPFTIHVSATITQQTFPTGIEDNLGGDNYYALVLLDPDRTVSAPPPAPAVLGHVLTNQGNIADTFELTWTSSGAFTPASVVFYADNDASGTLSAGDVPLSDTDGDGNPDTGLVAGLNTMVPLLAEVTPPGSASPGSTATITLRATSAYDATARDTAVDVITLSGPALTLVKSADKSAAAPGDLITYSITYTNSGNQDALSVVITDAVPAPAVYVQGSASGAGTAVTYSHDGGGTYDASDAAPVTHLRWSLPGPLSPSSPGTVTFAVRVP